MNADHYVMRSPCKFCQHPNGIVEEKNGQNTVRCEACGKHNYNAPKAETGESERRITSREGIDPTKRARILERDGAKCCTCGRGSPDVILHLGHVISVADADKYKIRKDWINSDENLVTQCEECNLGQGGKSMAARVAVYIACREKGMPG